MNPIATTRVDLHCHSTASEISKLGIQRSLGLPECATPPQEVYELAKRRGMEFVTITDHDTIAGCLEIAHRPDVFISEELTAWFRGELQAVHVLCFGLTPDDHGWLQANARDVEACAEYLHSNQIACSLAHPFYAVEAPLTPAHRRRLAELFPVWETRNGSRARELNMPAAIYIETHGGTSTGGSDDHAGVDIGRTFTETPPAATPEQFLRHVREGRADARGEQGSAAKWAHAAMALATRALLLREAAANGSGPAHSAPRNTAAASEAPGEIDPDAVLKMAERVMSEGNVRHGSVAGDLSPDDARALLDAFVDAIGLELHGRALISYMQGDDFSHAELARRARRIHEKRLREVVEGTVESLNSGDDDLDLATRAVGLGRDLFRAAIPAIPYAPAAAFLGKEKAKLTPAEGPKRVALIADAIGGMHGVSHTLERIRVLGVPGYEVEVIGTDRDVDRRLPAVAEVEIPFYAGLEIGVPSLPAMVEVLAEGRFDLVHVTAPGPAGVIATLIARIMELPLLGSWHTELGAYAGLRSGAEDLARAMDAALSLFYRQCGRVLSPSPASDDSLARLGVERDLIGRWGRGVDTSRFDPGLRDSAWLRHKTGSASASPAADPRTIKVLYAGRLTKEKGIDLLAESFLRAREADPRLHLLLAGGGPEEDVLRERLGDAATLLGWLGGSDLPRAYASSDIFLFCSRTDTFGQVLVEAAASGLPAVAVAEGGPASIVVDGETGRLCEPNPEMLAAAVLQMAGAPAWRAKLGRQAIASAHGRTWEAALGQLAGGYERLLADSEAEQHAAPALRAA
jgi:glycosyltransferase involved in cell wall biosynthesis/predicted metal-dependent phosphoesterase TrpH